MILTRIRRLVSRIVTMAVEATEENDHVDKKTLAAQNTEMRGAWVARAKPPEKPLTDPFSSWVVVCDCRSTRKRRPCGLVA